MSNHDAKPKAHGAESASTAGLAGTQYIEYELLWQHDETGRMVWRDHPGPGDRWTLVPLMHEDELPDQNDAEYDAWYAVSRVISGVRMGPLVTANAGVTGLPERSVGKSELT